MDSKNTEAADFLAKLNQTNRVSRDRTIFRKKAKKLEQSYIW
jgi:hypothetical protein